MRISIVTNIEAAIGLATEYRLLSGFLTARGHEVTGIQYDIEEAPAERFDLAISLETVSRHLFDLASVHWYFANPEWLKPHLVNLIGKRYQRIFCKTHEAERILSPMFPGKVHYVGFLTRDQYEPGIPRENKFLHIGGNSSFRGTQAVLDAWKWTRNGRYIPAQLTIVSTALKDREHVPNVIILDRVSEEELRQLQNSHRFHLYPSGTEGFGHALHEALSVDAWILTTGAPPMNEVKSAIYVPSVRETQYNFAKVHEVSALDIHDAAFTMLKEGLNTKARGEFLAGNEEFSTLFGKHLESVDRRPTVQRIVGLARQMNGDRPSVAFMGNFEAPESTENMVKWALEDLGHEVETIQENYATLRQLEDAVAWNDIFLWVRTPDWLKVPTLEMTEFLESLTIPSVSLHLDKFWGIPEREEWIGKLAFWKTKFVFTADGSRQDDFKARGVNHFWMKPAVSPVYIHPGVPQEKYRCDVLFVGARHYHREYPFRPKLVEFLEARYGDRFRHIEGVRGHELNDVYASAKVIVGDCIFAGTPQYWSDRVPETIGRHGFLIHPIVEGLDVPLGAVYEPQNLDSLEHAIEMSLSWSDIQRRSFVRAGVDHITKNDTWNVRMAHILQVLKAS